MPYRSNSSVPNTTGWIPRMSTASARKRSTPLSSAISDKKGSMNVMELTLERFRNMFQRTNEEELPMLKVGVIGCGGMGRDHIKRLVERTQGATVTAVADMVDELLDKGAAIAGSGCKKFKNADDPMSTPSSSSLRALRTRTHCSPPFVRASASSARSPSARPPRTASPSSMPR